ncbi:MAG: hypothetical protein AAF329_17010 [Cyanobacteria bacterium P01_A01_bin.17]
MHISKYILIAAAIMVGAADASTVCEAQTCTPQAQVQSVPQQLLNLNLTAGQQRQFQGIQQETYSQIMTVLEPSQQELFLQSLEQRQSLAQLIPSLDLSSEQRSKVKQIIDAQEQKVQRILTPKQKRRLKELDQSPRTV